MMKISYLSLNFLTRVGDKSFYDVQRTELKNEILSFFLYLMAYQLFSGYLMPKLFSEKNSSDTI